MRSLGLAILIFGCANPSSQKTRSFPERDLGDHLEPVGGDDLGTGTHDLASPSVKVDLSMGGGTVDLAQGGTLADLSQLHDLAQPVSSDPPIYVHTASTLYLLNPDTYDLTTIGDFNAGDEITDIAEKDDGSLVAVSRTDIFTVNKNTGAATHFGALNLTDVNALTYLSDGRLLASDIPGNVYEISLSVSGIFNITIVNGIGSYGSSQTTAGDLVSVDNGTMWGLANGGGAATDTNNALMIVNNVNGTGTQKGNTGFGKLWGSAYSRHKILAVSSTGQIIEINPTNGAGTLKKTHAGLSFFGATSNPTVLQ